MERLNRNIKSCLQSKVAFVCQGMIFRVCECSSHLRNGGCEMWSIAPRSARVTISPNRALLSCIWWQIPNAYICTYILMWNRGTQRNASHYSWLAHICRSRGHSICPPSRSIGCSIHPAIAGHGKPLYGSYSVSGCDCGGIRSDRVLFLLFPIAHLQLFLKNNKIQAAAWKNATYVYSNDPHIHQSACVRVFPLFRFFCFVCVASSPILVYILENASAQPRSWIENSAAIGSSDIVDQIDRTDRPKKKTDSNMSSVDEDLTPEQIAVLQKAFNSFDHQKTGSISIEIVADILRLMGQPFDKKILEELIEEVDEDKSGRLEFGEFVQLAAKFIVEEDAEAMQKELREAFRLYDKQGNGFIPTTCLKEILKELDDQLTEQELDIMIEEIDSDGSGTVDFDEFMEMMTGE
ncbi:hypothetical protein M5D96_005295 [Drosophila gunungcola]|uniref:EF-hand domain-containing protein n=2 Tax=melanogaster group TaxID=32346 RepID=A0A9Q0BRF0_9MUSC|nr:hypothetical protein M5D96_005295 [Drosophila gunungcola]